ncbi:hypothetical protein ASQ66_gp32 [Aeropyrum pernix spindle-shaped virus 1]|uniref:Uncharacterized protein n=1 Tax=Aeropyrum pernix (strain ATCC 700893 / DSM 11879 / JCM 9820 / NBRC 100138 / K1) TaxID=272557 RepID=Q9YDQ0_AERPE|nr:hypothetical protein [Aeropyrum pernix]YP_009177762.1 hypothetical protein ASQ66_gp32 [Aeropyrum pernix spindle-shaped virus 1]BAA79847.2 hypothetical protein APE_0867.1 [Aeropyrum pernix spindle-shaped virus 1] [Aeropyrum pernix K1]CCD22120.1 TPA: hypothetical protein [Aeropyrum pernix spindle-shaped virus 1]
MFEGSEYLYPLYRHLYGLGLTREEWLRAREAFRERARRCPRCAFMDVGLAARHARSLRQWMRSPNRYDIPGVDSPEVGWWLESRDLLEPYSEESKSILGEVERARRAVELYFGEPVATRVRVRYEEEMDKPGVLGYWEHRPGWDYGVLAVKRGLGERFKDVVVHELVHAWSLGRYSDVPYGEKAGNPAWNMRVVEGSTETAAKRVLSLLGLKPSAVAYSALVERLSEGGAERGVEAALEFLRAARERRRPRGEYMREAVLLKHTEGPDVYVSKPPERLPGEARDLLSPKPFPAELALDRTLRPFAEALKTLRRQRRRGGRRRRWG